MAYLSLHPFGQYIGSGSIAHRTGHVIAFGVLALLLLPLSRTGGQRALTISGVIAVAMATEMAQWLRFRQPFEWWDVRDDGIGILVAWAAVRLIRIRCTLRG